MQGHDLPRLDIDNGRTGIAAESGGVVGHGIDVVFETRDFGSRPRRARLQALDVVFAAKDAVLHIEVASHVSGRVADDDDVAVQQVLRRADGEWQSTA